MAEVKEIFSDSKLVNRIKEKLPKLFGMAALESSRAGKIGMEAGSLRERIVTALLIYKFGLTAVDTKLPITEPEADVKLSGREISIKTITGEGGVKAVWTVDAQSAERFIKEYAPRCDILLVKLDWGLADGKSTNKNTL